jgi:uncharacterized repeat protein (TIGR04076 family)
LTILLYPLQFFQTPDSAFGGKHRTEGDMDQYKVMGKILEIRGTGICSYGHQVGEVFEFTEMGSSICQWALNSIFPFFTALKFGGRFPWSKDPDRLQVACPDPDNVVVFEIWRERI